jgi:hypothetical protein
MASLLLLLTTWRTGIFPRPGMLVVWFIVALALQLVGEFFSPAWTIGLVAQVILAVYVAVRFKLA